jgi:hypothetical protein
LPGEWSVFSTWVRHKVCTLTPRFACLPLRWSWKTLT